VTHFLIMILFTALVAVVFGVIGKDTSRARVIYGLKVFAEFTVIGLVIAWVLYYMPL
jgi:hypothetical protein